MFRIDRNPFYNWKTKIPMKIPEFKRSRIGLIVEFCRVPNRFPNQVPPAKLDHPQNNQIALPLCSWLVVRPVQSLICRACMPLVDFCVCFIGQRPSKATMYFILYYFHGSIFARNEETTTPHMLCPGRVSSLICLRPLTPTIGWLLCHPIRWRPSKPNAPQLSLFLFFGRSIRPPKGWENIPPFVIAQCTIAPTSYPSMLLTFSWLLCQSIKWRPPKAWAPSLSLFFDGCCFGTPNK
jgi:hypothetical protein